MVRHLSPADQGFAIAVRAGAAAVEEWYRINPAQNPRAVNEDFRNINLVGVVLQRADLTGSNFSNAQLASAALLQCTLLNANFSSADMSDADLTGSHLANATFSQAKLGGIDLSSTSGLSLAKGLQSTRFASSLDIRGSDLIRLPFIDAFVNWARIRSFGQIPLFTPSYFTLLFTLWHTSFTSELTIAVNSYAGNIGDILRILEIPPNFVDFIARSTLLVPAAKSLLIIIASFLLFFASLTYLLCCPSIIQRFSKDEWLYDLNRPEIHYLFMSWKHRWMRVLCAALYASGGLLAIGLALYTVLSQIMTVIHASLI